MWGFNDNLWESVLSFHHLDPKDQARAVRLVSKLLYTLSHLSRIVPFPGDTKFVSCHAFQF